MRWVRTSVDIGTDPSVGALADELKVDRAKAVGCLVLVICQMPAHARDGSIAAVTDSTLEGWALWAGKRGAFAAAFRRYLCTEQGVVTGWEKHNGAAIRKADGDAKRQADFREKTRLERERSRAVTRDVTHGVARDVTGRDELLNYPTTTPPKPPSFPQVSHIPASTTPPANAPGDLLAAIPEPYQPALVALRHLARHPAAFDGELRMILSGVHGPSGRMIPGAVLGRALHEMAANSMPFNASLLRGYLRRMAVEDTEGTQIAAELGRPLTAGESNFLAGLRALDVTP